MPNASFSFPSVTVTPHAIASLRYRFYAGPVDLSPLVVRQVRRFDWEQARVSAYILGASHALTVESPGGATFTELLTCLPPRNHAEGVGVSGREFPVPGVNGEPWETTFAKTGLRGTVRLQRFDLASAGNALATDCAPENTLHEPFLLATGETAWTRVGWRIDGPHLFVETIHTYPEDRAGVRSETFFALSPGGEP